MKFSKKVISVLLSVLMVASCFSVLPFQALASTHSMSDLDNLMTSYKTKMDGTVYSNMDTAYDAWYSANAFKLGVTAGLKNADDVDTYYTTLENAINNMTAVTYKKGTTVPIFSDEQHEGDYTGWYNNVLYSPTCSGSNASMSGSKLTINLFYSNTALLYDGETSPKTIVMFSGVGGSSSRYVYNVYPTTGSGSATDNSEMKLTEQWRGRDGRTNYGWVLSQGYRVGNTASGGVGSSGDFKSSTYYFANSLQFDGSMGTNEYSKAYNLSWQFYGGSNTTVKTNDLASNCTSSNTIYVVNYKALKDACTGQSEKLKNITTYSYSSVKNYFQKVSAATNLDPNTYFSSVSDLATSVNNCTGAIKTAIDDINTASASLETPNIDSYTNLATYFSARTSLYNENNSTGYYTEDSFATFKTAYDNAATVINSIADKTTYMSDATSTYDNLVSAYTSLQKAASYIDDSEMQALFDTYDTIVSAYYLVGYSELQATANKILTNYNNNDRTQGIILTDTTENQKIYAELLNEFKANFSALRFSPDLKQNVNGTFESLNDVIARAEAFDSTKYSNGATLISGLAQAKNYRTSIASEVFTNQKTQYDNYIAEIAKLSIIISSLEAAFSTLTDGQIITTTVGTTDSVQAGNGGIYFYMKDATRSTVLFKTDAGSKSYTLPFNMTVDNWWKYSFLGNNWYAGARISGLGYNSVSSPSDTASVTATNGLAATCKLNWYDNTSNDGNACPLTLASGSTLNYHQALMQGSNTGTFLDVKQNSAGHNIYGNVTITVPERTSNQDRAYTVTTPTLYEYTYVNDSHGGEYTATDNNNNVSLTVVDVSDLFSVIKSSDSVVLNTNGNADKTFTSASWKVFTDALVQAKASFEYKTMSATDIGAKVSEKYNLLYAAFNSLRTATDYSTLDSSYTTKNTDRNSFSSTRANGSATAKAANYLTYSNGKVKNFFDINLDKVKNIASAEGADLDTTFKKGDTYYTVNSVAYFDKVLNGIYKGNVLTSDKTEERATQNKFTNGNSYTVNGTTYYGDSSTKSDIQTAIDTRSNALSSLNTSTLKSTEALSYYDSFDGFISDIKKTDFSVYDNNKADAFKQKAYEYLTNGVYVVDQQLFSATADATASDADKVAYDGSSNYYTGLGSANSKTIDECTTELLTMYNNLVTDADEDNTSHVKTYTLTTNVYTDGNLAGSDVKSLPVGTNYKLDPASICDISAYNLLTYNSAFNDGGIFSLIRNDDGTYLVKNIGNNITVNVYYQSPATAGEINIKLYDRTGKQLDYQKATSGSEVTVSANSITVNGKTTTVTGHTGGFTFDGWYWNGVKLNEGSNTINSNANIQSKYINNGGVLYNVNVTDANKNAVTYYVKKSITNNGVTNITKTEYSGLNALPYGTDILFSTEDSNFLAWAIQTNESSYSILSYNKDYECLVFGNMNIVELTKSSVLGDYGFSTDNQSKINEGSPFIFVRSSFETNINGANSNNSEDLTAGEVYNSATKKVTYICRFTPLANSSNCSIIRTGMISMNKSNYTTYGVADDNTMFQLDSTDSNSNKLIENGVISTYTASNSGVSGQFTVTSSKLDCYKRAFVTYSTTINDKVVYITEYSDILEPIA